jgi:hypothetical protein
MVEVAISLAIIGFALVAVIGILPEGLNVQKENREETIINQEASLWMDAIRQGAEGMNYLTNYVDAIEIVSTELDEDGRPVQGSRAEGFATAEASSLGTGNEYYLLNGFRIIGLLSTPKYEALDDGSVRSNHVVAYVRALSGAAAEKAPQANATVLDSSFSYRMTCEIVPFFAHAGPWTNFCQFIRQTGTNDPVSTILANNAHEVRLHFEWPLRPPYDFRGANPEFPSRVGKGQLSFRETIGGAIDDGRIDPLTGMSNNLVFFRPSRFDRGRGAE